VCRNPQLLLDEILSASGKCGDWEREQHQHHQPKFLF
jgi:hypothetical protein